ncbi:MAG: dehydrogenase/reductase SDR family protein 12 [Candidatus Aldehydirespiratoraceae bacterium]|jgi:dehydrogenase/reductase SDR family protein 12
MFSALDTALEFPIVTSFTRLGYDIRSRLGGWTSLDDYDLSGRVAVVTGATSGLGLTAAGQLAAAGADVVLLGRNVERTAAARAMITDAHPQATVSTVIADMGDLDEVRAAAAQILKDHHRLDVLVHNAGALSAHRTEAPSGIEATVASQVVGPFLLTSLLLDRLCELEASRVITVSSGGMYAADLAVGHLEMGLDEYNGTEQYARAKRAQVALNEEWAGRFADTPVRFHAMHPGWADTPGVAASLPTFRRVVGPLLRSSEQGADTIVWLAADDSEPLTINGEFWLDRRCRSVHRLGRTRRSDTLNRRDELWRWCVQQCNLDPEESRP